MDNTKLLEFGKNLLNIESLSDGLTYISTNTKRMTGADRCSIFIYTGDELWTTLSDGTEKITIPFDMGIVGHTIRMAKPILENEPYDNQNFLSDVDMQTGYYTQNILTSPIFNSKKKVIGVLELLNKEGGFDKRDTEFLSFIAHYVSSFIEIKTAM